jgi:transcription initiation factor IIE alpha subunit
MGNALNNRIEAYYLTEDNHNNQNEIVYSAIKRGFIDAHKISEATGIILGSVRRSLNNLKERGLIADLPEPVYYPFIIKDEIRYIPSTQFKIIPKQLKLI